MPRLSLVTVGVLGVPTLLLGIYWEPSRGHWTRISTGT
jgi:hypothetical protein